MAGALEIVDAHTHIFPTAAETAAMSSGTAAELEKFDFDGDEADALATMDRLGIRKMVILPLRRPRSDYERRVAELEAAGEPVDADAVMAEVAARWSRYNDWAAELASRRPDRFRAMVGLDPVFLGREWAQGEIDRCLAAGACGLKIMPASIGVAPDDERMAVVWENADRLGLPVVSMCGLTPYSRVAHPDNFEAVASRYPRLKLVLAHSGMGAEREVAALARRHANVNLDTSSWFDQRMHPSWLNRMDGDRAPFTLEEAAAFFRAVGIDRVLFGTNWAIFPLEAPLQEARALPLTEPERRQLFSENYCRVYEDSL